jgi:hypothetical protein
MFVYPRFAQNIGLGSLPSQVGEVATPEEQPASLSGAMLRRLGALEEPLETNFCRDGFLLSASRAASDFRTDVRLHRIRRLGYYII